MSATPAPKPTPAAPHASRRALRAGAAALLLLLTGGVTAPAAVSAQASRAPAQGASFSAADARHDPARRRPSAPDPSPRTSTRPPSPGSTPRSPRR
ncbi:hypothetical protein WKI68_25525 [Streptomyces sp. MS1.HAVA.3]|uniref:Uncharacterized protein n=1 Tax=Streptomyces caledonius TaxID=3134107 RepID=A0ABU8U7G1_9ACTN